VVSMPPWGLWGREDGRGDPFRGPSAAHPSLMFWRPARVSPGPSPACYLLQQVQSPQGGDYWTYFLDLEPIGPILDQS